MIQPAMHSCKVCSSSVDLLLELKGPNISSIATTINSDSCLYKCRNCGHIQKTSAVDLSEYYDTEYKLWNQSESSDSLYEITKNGESVFRLEKITEILLSTIDIKPSSKILDYGCAKGLLSKKIYERTNAMPYLYDLTSSYLDYWNLWAKPDHLFFKEIPTSFYSTFDCIICNFVFEHVDNPVEELVHLKRYLRNEGKIVVIVPNPLANPGDYLVVDHIQNYSEKSIFLSLVKAGFTVTTLESHLYRGAFILVANNDNRLDSPHDDYRFLQSTIPNQSIELVMQQYNFVQNYALEKNGSKIYIYGAGFYGNWYFMKLNSSLEILGFVDKNPDLAGQRIHGLPILSIKELPESIDYRLLIAVNPSVVNSVFEQLSIYNPELISNIDSITSFVQ